MFAQYVLLEVWTPYLQLLLHIHLLQLIYMKQRSSMPIHCYNLMFTHCFLVAVSVYFFLVSTSQGMLFQWHSICVQHKKHWQIHWQTYTANNVWFRFNNNHNNHRGRKKWKTHKHWWRSCWFRHVTFFYHRLEIDIKAEYHDVPFQSRKCGENYRRICVTYLPSKISYLQ